MLSERNALGGPGPCASVVHSPKCPDLIAQRSTWVFSPRLARMSGSRSLYARNMEGAACGRTACAPAPARGVGKQACTVSLEGRMGEGL